MTDRASRRASRRMRAVRTEGTAPERALRAALVRTGIGPFEENARDLPGSPDLVFRRERVAVFVHGCFWHGCRAHWRPPRTRTAFWTAKARRNRERDRRVAAALDRRGWVVLIAWEHDLGEAAAADGVAAVVARTVAFARSLRRGVGG